MAVPAVTYGVLSLTIPESPRFLIAKHKIPAATAILSRLLGETNIELKINRIRQTVERETEPSWRDLRRPRARSRASCGRACCCWYSSSSSAST